MAVQGYAKTYVSFPRIDWTNSLTHGLVGCYLPGTFGGMPIGVGPTLARGDGGAGSRVMTKEGYGYKTATAATNTGFIGPAPTSFTGSAFSVYWRGVLLGTADDFTSLVGVTYTNADSDPFEVHSLCVDQGVSATNISAQWNTAATYTLGTFVNTTSSRNKNIGLCGTFLAGGNAVLYIGGVSVASDVFGAGAPTVSGPQIVINQYVPGTGRSPNATCNLVFFWNRQLLATEVLQLELSPHAFLIYPEEDMIALMVGAAAAAADTFGNNMVLLMM
jgi:hypothetical protein